MLKIIQKATKIIVLVAIVFILVPSTTMAAKNNSSEFGWSPSSWGDSGWGSVDSYYDEPYGSSWGDSGWGSIDSYYDTGYSYPTSYANYGYSLPSYTTPPLSLANYTAPASGAPANTVVHTSSTNNNTANATANAVSSNVNNNINNNNVYVYTTPSGTAVVNNPNHVALQANCYITPTNPRVGQYVTATASATGGLGDYTYTWGGDLATGYGSNASFTSYTTGTKNINVTVRSGQEVVTRSCSVTFVSDYTYNNNLSATCYPSTQTANVGQLVTWRVNVNGNNTYSYGYEYYNSGYGNYSYNWTGTDGLYGTGNVISKTYTYPGYKTANVTVYSNGQTVTATCSVNINQVASTYIPPTTGSPVSGVYVQPAQIKRITTGTPVSGVYLNDLPATGVDLNWKHYMIGSMVLILASVAFILSRSRKSIYATLEK